MHVGEYFANILVDDKELEEYEVTVDAGGTQATCWVASEVGKVYAPLFSTNAPEVLTSFKKFTVQWKCHSQERLIQNGGEVRLDGTYCGGKIMSVGTLDRTTPFICRRYRVERFRILKPSAEWYACFFATVLLSQLDNKMTRHCWDTMFQSI